MLVLVSDLHLTDGSSGTTINETAFKEFADAVCRMADEAGAERVDVVFLGDIIDIIRSAAWLSTTVRPWSSEDIFDPTDAEKKTLKDYAVQITETICTLPKNLGCVAHLSRLRQAQAAANRPVTYSYIIGNHDWLVDRYPETRAKVASFLGLDDNPDQKFPEQGFWKDYGVFGRHGDIYDPMNFDGDRDKSSLGDAIVIDLLNRFPAEVEKQLGSTLDPEFIGLLKEVDNVRPLLDVPQWIVSACEQAKDEGLAKSVQGVWNRIVADFPKIPFVENHTFSQRLALQVALKISTGLSLDVLAEVLENPAARLLGGSSDLVAHASKEIALAGDDIDFVVFGHTHNFGIWPVGKFIQGAAPLRQSYINTGTWRKVFEDSKFAAFSGYNVMTFVAFYLEKERGERIFEAWNGSLA